MSILGIDNGYHYTKTSDNVMFASTIKKGKDIDINKDTIQVRINGIDYVVGEDNGEYVADNNKIDSKVTEICTMTAIAKSFSNQNLVETNIVAGLPVNYYSKQKDDFKNKLLSYGKNIIELDNRMREVQITDAIIYPQSAGVVFMNAKDLKRESTIVIDIGGGTWDISQFEGLKMVEKSTYAEGQLVLYSKLAQKINADYDCKFKNYHIDNILLRNWFTADGKKISTDVLNDDIESHINSVATEIKRDFSYRNVDNIFVIGGGAIRHYDRLKNHFSNAQLVDDPQFCNANAFELMGQMKFSK